MASQLETTGTYVARHYGQKHAHFFGHSFGALFGIYVLLHAPNLFDDYCLASPSLWWGKGSYLPQQKPWFATPKAILIMQGEYEEFPERDPQMTADRLARIQARQQMRPFSLEAFTAELRHQGNAAEFRRISKKDHGSVIPDALKNCIARWQSQN